MSTRIAESEALHVRARAFVAAFERGDAAPEPFDRLACDLARFQAAHEEGYARLSAARGIDLRALSDASAIAAVPTDAFKVARVATFPEGEAVVTFRTSGTTIGARGTHAMRDVTTYDTAALAFGKHWLARDFAAPVGMVVLAPSPAVATDSSLVHMCARFVEHMGKPQSVAQTFVIDGEVIDLSAFDERVATALTDDAPMLVLGTSFAFVHFLEALGDDTFALPAGSRVMQTGGYKGKSREVPAATLRRDLARAFGIPERAIVSEYGMTELSSQFYEQTMFEPHVPHGVYAEPPWARVEPVDPDTLVPVAEGHEGIAKVIDLMNVDSAVAVLTQDRVRRVPQGFELLGRLPGAPPRGCSIAIDELLGRS